MDGRSGGIVLSVALAFSMADGSSAQDEGRRKPPRQVGPDVIELDHSDISLPLRDIAPIPPRFQDNEEHPVKKLPHRHPFRPLGSRPDPVLQTLAPGSLVSTTPGLSFDGVGVPNYGVASAPPDTVGAVGATPTRSPSSTTTPRWVSGPTRTTSPTTCSMPRARRSWAPSCAPTTATR